MLPTAIIFDVDGTLIDTYELYMESYRRALLPFADRIPPDFEVETRKPSSERHFLTQWLGEELGAECHDAMCEVYEELHSSHGGGFYDGVPEMLTALRAAGLPLGVVTGKGRRAWEVTERELPVGDFDVVITEDDVDHPKPHPGGLMRALAAMGARAEQAVYIGDSVVDVEAAREAGMLVGAALWPKTAPGERDEFINRIQHHRPDWLFAHPEEVARTFTSGR